MRKVWRAGLMTLGLGLAGWLGLDAYRTHRQVQTLGQTVYRELDGDGFPAPAGVLDDPVFGHLPPPDPRRPVSPGRYKPPEKRAATVTAAQPEPTSTPAAAPEPAGRPPTPPASAAPSPARPSATAPGTAPKPPAPASPPVQAPSSLPAAASAPTTPAPVTPAAATPVPASPPVAPASFLARLNTTAKLHLLLIANDQETLGGGRGDVLLVLTLDPVARELTLLSIPRDTRVNLPDHGAVKINAAYAYGGARLQTEAVERFLGLPMDKYVEISLGGFRQAIDLVGGVTVHPAFGFELDGSSFAPGVMTLNGEQALAYARMRKQDPQGDLGRNARQQEVIRSLMGALGQLPAGQLQKLLDQLSAYLHTNFSPSEVVKLRAVHAYMLDHQQTARVGGVNRKLDGAWFYVVPDAERRRLHLLLR